MNNNIRLKYPIIAALLSLMASLIAEEPASEMLMKDIPIRNEAPQPAQVYTRYAEGTGAGYGSRAAVTIPLTVITPPLITSPLYAIKGWIKYSHVRGDAYLEMWSIFKKDGKEARYFSRTLGSFGPMAKVTGDSNWREFILPFNRNGIDTPPIQLEINLILPNGGNAEVRDLSLIQYSNAPKIPVPTLAPPNPSPADFLSPSSSLNGRFIRIIPVISGICMGLFVIVMSIATMRSRNLSICCGKIAFVFGILVLMSGCIAAIFKRPHEFYSPLLIMGIAGSVAFGLFTWLLMKQARQEELRRISAMDAGA